ncbi:MAG: hypothetical protein H8D97_00135 [Proteobacteria bacterium]|nr:hypothetical protein [Pseudomonadota bacterium]
MRGPEMGKKEQQQKIIDVIFLIRDRSRFYDWVRKQCSIELVPSDTGWELYNKKRNKVMFT